MLLGYAKSLMVSAPGPWRGTHGRCSITMSSSRFNTTDDFLLCLAKGMAAEADQPGRDPFVKWGSNPTVAAYEVIVANKVTRVIAFHNLGSSVPRSSPSPALWLHEACRGPVGPHRHQRAGGFLREGGPEEKRRPGRSGEGLRCIEGHTPVAEECWRW